MSILPKKLDFHFDEYDVSELVGLLFLAITTGFFSIVWIAILSAIF